MTNDCYHHYHHETYFFYLHVSHYHYREEIREKKRATGEKSNTQILIELTISLLCDDRRKRGRDEERKRGRDEERKRGREVGGREEEREICNTNFDMLDISSFYLLFFYF